MGFGVVAAVVGAGWIVWGRDALVAVTTGALLALGVHLLAAQRLRRSLGGEVKQLAKAYAFGMALRFLGIGLVVGAVVFRRAWFPAVPTFFGYGVVLVPLLFMEIRFLK